MGYAYTSFNATNPADFTVIGTSLTFAQGERQKFITVNIVDDRISEFQESFSLDLTSITGKARLGSKTRLTITIETSDNPYGLFGIFNTSLSVSIPNPVVNQNLSFPLSRVDGALGRSEVRLHYLCLMFYVFAMYVSRLTILLLDSNQRLDLCMIICI